MTWLIPIISAFCFRSGGVGRDDRFLPFLNPPTPWANKIWRWGMGIPIALITKNWLCIPAYFIATNVFSYGENSWLRKLTGRNLCWITFGGLVGACSFFVLPLSFAIIQTLLGIVSFWGLMWLSNTGIEFGPDGANGLIKKWYLDQGILETTFGFLGTIMYLWR